MLVSFVSPVLGSVTVAVLETTALSTAAPDTVCVNVSTCEPPAGKPVAHVTVLVTSEQAPAGPVEPVSVAELRFVEGKTSVTTSGLATVATGPFIEPGPLLTTVIVHVIVPPNCTNGDGLTALVTARS